VWHAIAGDVAELGSPVGRCRAMAMSPSAMERREHHLVCDRVPGRVTGVCSAVTARGTPLASSPSLSLKRRARIRSGVLSAGNIAVLGSPVGRCRAMAMSSGATVCRDHHLVGDRVRLPGPRRGEREEEQAAVLQPP